jgi:hypothetical protein
MERGESASQPRSVRYVPKSLINMLKEIIEVCFVPKAAIRIAANVRQSLSHGQFLVLVYRVPF